MGDLEILSHYRTETLRSLATNTDSLPIGVRVSCATREAGTVLSKANAKYLTTMYQCATEAHGVGIT